MRVDAITRNISAAWDFNHCWKINSIFCFGECQLSLSTISKFHCSYLLL
jgi:hypothetical protein